MSQVDCFLKIDGIEGESQDAQHKGEIEVQFWSFGESQSISSNLGGGASVGKVNLQPFQFTVSTSKASPKLFLAGASGQHLKTATLTCRRSGQKELEFLKITLTDVLVSAFATSGTSDQLSIDQLSLSYSKIVYEFTPQKADGTPDAIVRAGWDVKTGKAED